MHSWDPSEWRNLDNWLWGVDLFNRFYFWEAHEAWEELWTVSPRATSPSLFLQGLIQVSAALLKVHLRSTRGSRKLSVAGIEKLSQVSDTFPSFMGLDVVQTITEMEDYFRPLARDVLPLLDAHAPVLSLDTDNFNGDSVGARP